MPVVLAKGSNIALGPAVPELAQLRVVLGWASLAPTSSPLELDGVVLLVGDDGKASHRDDLLLSGQLPGPGRERDPAPAARLGDVEKLVVSLADVPGSIARLLFAVAIYDAAARRQTFAAVRGAYVRLVDHRNGLEIARYTLSDEPGPETAMVFGELYRHDGQWKFRAVGQGYADGLRGIAASYGAPV